MVISLRGLAFCEKYSARKVEEVRVNSRALCRDEKTDNGVVERLQGLPRVSANHSFEASKFAIFRTLGV